MASSGVINGTDLRLYLDGNPIGHATSCTLSLSRETRETIDKDNVAGYATSEGGQRSYSISFENFLSEDTTLNSTTVEGLADLVALFAGDSFAWRFSTDVTGDRDFSGTAFLTDLSMTAPVEENSTVSGTLTGTGAFVSGVIA